MELVQKKIAKAVKVQVESSPIPVNNKRERLLMLGDRLQNAHCRFNICEDEREIEAVIYEIKSLEATIKTLMNADW